MEHWSKMGYGNGSVNISLLVFRGYKTGTLA